MEALCRSRSAEKRTPPAKKTKHSHRDAVREHLSQEFKAPTKTSINMKIFCLLIALMLLLSSCPHLSSPTPDMLLLITLLFLAAVPERSLGQDDEDDNTTDGEEKGGEDANRESKGDEGTEEEESEEEELPPSGVDLKTQKEIINKHNAIRRAVKPPAANMLKMVWDESVGTSAKEWTDQCKLTMSPREERISNGTFCGEIVFQANYINSWAEVIEFWHGKKANFQYGVGAIDSVLNVYPYTQMIWYNSYRLGCAANYCHGEKYPYFYVCRYCPAGNYDKLIATPYKKGKSCEDCPKKCQKKLCTNSCKYMDHSFDCPKKKELFTCKNPMVKNSCQATCRCKSAII